MKNIETLNFIDKESNSNVFIMFRFIESIIGISIAIEKNGDIDLLFGIDDCKKIIDNLNNSISISQMIRNAYKGISTIQFQNSVYKIDETMTIFAGKDNVIIHFFFKEDIDENDIEIIIETKDCEILIKRLQEAIDILEGSNKTK